MNRPDTHPFTAHLSHYEVLKYWDYVFDKLEEIEKRLDRIERLLEEKHGQYETNNRTD